MRIASAPYCSRRRSWSRRHSILVSSLMCSLGSRLPSSGRLHHARLDLEQAPRPGQAAGPRRVGGRHEGLSAAGHLAAEARPRAPRPAPSRGRRGGPPRCGSAPRDRPRAGQRQGQQEAPALPGRRGDGPRRPRSPAGARRPGAVPPGSDPPGARRSGAPQAPPAGGARCSSGGPAQAGREPHVVALAPGPEGRPQRGTAAGTRIRPCAPGAPRRAPGGGSSHASRSRPPCSRAALRCCTTRS